MKRKEKKVDGSIRIDISHYPKEFAKFSPDQIREMFDKKEGILTEFIDSLTVQLGRPVWSYAVAASTESESLKTTEH